MQMMEQVECNQIVKYVPLHTLFKPTDYKSGLQPMASGSGTGGLILLEHLRIAGYVTAGHPARALQRALAVQKVATCFTLDRGAPR